MKKLITITLVVASNLIGFSQDHFSGISTSSRVGILNGMINPAEYSNLSKKFEVQSGTGNARYLSSSINF